MNVAGSLCTRSGLCLLTGWKAQDVGISVLCVPANRILKYFMFQIDYFRMGDARFVCGGFVIFCIYVFGLNEMRSVICSWENCQYKSYTRWNHNVTDHFAVYSGFGSTKVNHSIIKALLKMYLSLVFSIFSHFFIYLTLIFAQQIWVIIWK